MTSLLEAGDWGLSMEIACPMSSQLRLHYLYKNLIMLQQDNPLDNTYSIIRV